MPQQFTTNLEENFAQQLGVSLMALSKLAQAVRRGDSRLTREALEEAEILLELHIEETSATAPKQQRAASSHHLLCAA